MSKTRQTKLKDGHNVIMVDKQSGLTHVLASHRVRIPSDEVKEKVEDLPPVLRLQPGAEIQYLDDMFRRRTGIVAGRTRVSMRILLEDGQCIEPNKVVEWPWGKELAD